MRPSASRVRAVVDLVAAETGIDRGLILSTCKARHVAVARWRAFRVLRDYGYSLPSIGHAFGMDHTSVLHGLRRLVIVGSKYPPIASSGDNPQGTAALSGEAGEQLPATPK